MRDFIDYLMEISRFTELRWQRKFTAFTVSDFLAECIKTCIDIKNKYGISGESLTPEKAVDVCLLEGFYLDFEPENSFDREKTWIALAADGVPAFWVNPNLEIEDGQFYLYEFLAICLLPQVERDLILTSKVNPKTMDEYLDYPPLLIAVLKVDLINALLRSGESEAELNALLSIATSGGEIETVRDLRRVTKIRNLSPVRRKRLIEKADQWVAAENDAETSEIWNELKSFCEVKDETKEK